MLANAREALSSAGADAGVYSRRAPIVLEPQACRPVDTTTEAQVRKVIADCTALLKKNPAASDDIRVHLVRLGDCSLDLEVNAWLLCPQWGDFLSMRQELLLGFLRIVTEAGTKLAYPTRAIADDGAQEKGAEKPAGKAQ